MNILNFYSKLYSSIGNYFADLDKTNDYVVEKHFDIESQKNADIIVKSDNKLLTNSCEYFDNKTDIMSNYLMPKYLIIGCGFDRINGLEWKRTSNNNDYIVSYKGSHLIQFEQIKKIYIKIKYKKSIDFEKILKLYIDCGKNLDLTIIYLEL